AREWADSELLVLFVACICHHIAASQSYNAPQRLEVEGADTAAVLLRNYGQPESDVHKVLDCYSIAHHTWHSRTN
ncbi:hypothetical protein A1O1_09056, partial [Capronia coronata CBS 617.96]